MIPADLLEELGGAEAIQQWITNAAAPDDKVEQFAHCLLAEHTEWDSPHQFVGFSWDGNRIDQPFVAVIVPDVHPHQYPSTMQQLSAEYLPQHATKHITRGFPPIVGFALQIEAFGLIGRKDDLTDEQRDALENRKLHTLEESVEQCTIMIVTIEGKCWWLSKNRHDGAESLYRPGDLDHGGAFTESLRRIADVAPLPYIAAERLAQACAEADAQPESAGAES